MIIKVTKITFAQERDEDWLAEGRSETFIPRAAILCGYSNIRDRLVSYPAMELFTANFTVDEVNPDGKKFDNVSRIHCRSENNDSDLILDVNTQIYAMERGDFFSLVLSHQISSEPVNDSVHWHPSMLVGSNAQKYEYVMHGDIYRYEEDVMRHKATIYVSYGGLLMSLKGDQNSLKEISAGRTVYLMIRKIRRS
jgi:DNA-directed RNA polymerase I, II, and III subunit RPABC3